jgi:glycosyltransferase involved in cell wall biosynthesis
MPQGFSTTMETAWPRELTSGPSELSIGLSKPRVTRAEDQQLQPCELSIVMPCLNEAETLEVCIRKARGFLIDNGVSGEVVIADNGSTDGSQAIAIRCGARVVDVPVKGYGSALLAGIRSAQGRFVIMGDADDSYDFVNLMPFVEKLREGYDLVMGNRFRGGIMPNAMPPLHKYLGNPVLSFLGNLFFKSPCKDFHCGLRGFRKATALDIDLRTTGMEFASEMVVKMTLHGKRITEVATVLSKDGRSRPPHLRSWRDGWRHLRFLLLFSPRWLFFYPGIVLMVLGGLIGLWLLPGPQLFEGVTMDVHTLLYASLAIIIGFQSAIFALFTEVFASSEGLLPENPRVRSGLEVTSLEKGLVAGIALVLAGILGSIFTFSTWGLRSFGPLQPSEMMRAVIPSITSLTLGVQIIFSSFFLSVLRLKRK